MSKEHTTSSGFRPSNSLANSLDERFDKDTVGEAPESASSTAFLVGLTGRYAGKLFKIKQGEHVIGRTSKALVQLDEKAVSHQHARLTLGAGGCIVRDLDSTNGTYVNDARLDGPRELRAGDVIRFGNTNFGFLTDAEDDEQHTRALARVTNANVIPQATGRQSMPSFSGDAIVPAGHVQVIGTTGGHGMTPADEGNSLDKILDILGWASAFVKRYWRLLLISGVIFAALGAASIRVAPPVSTAEFEILLRADQTKTTARYYASRDVEYFIAAEKNFLHESLVSKTMRDMELPTPEGLVRSYARSLTFEKAGPSMYAGSFSHTDPAFAEKFLAQHLQNYLESEIGKSIKVLSSEVELLRQQYEDNEEQLRQQEESLREFKEGNLEALPELAEGQVANRAGLMMRRDTLSAELTRASEQLALVRKQLASEDAFVGSRVQRSEPYEQRIVAVRQQIAEAKAKGLAEGHPDITKLRSEEQSLTRLRDQALNAETTETDRRANPEHKRLQNEAGQLQVTVAATSKELSQVEGRLAEIAEVTGKMPEVEVEMAQQFRQLQGSKKLHEELHSQLKAKELEYQFERASVAARYEVMKPPEAFDLNYTQSTFKRAGAGFVMGALLGMMLALLHWLTVYARNRRERLAGVR